MDITKDWEDRKINSTLTDGTVAEKWKSDREDVDRLIVVATMT